MNCDSIDSGSKLGFPPKVLFIVVFEYPRLGLMVEIKLKRDATLINKAGGMRKSRKCVKYSPQPAASAVTAVATQNSGAQLKASK